VHRIYDDADASGYFVTDDHGAKQDLAAAAAGLSGGKAAAMTGRARMIDRIPVDIVKLDDGAMRFR